MLSIVSVIVATFAIIASVSDMRNREKRTETRLNEAIDLLSSRFSKLLSECGVTIARAAEEEAVVKGERLEELNERLGSLASLKKEQIEAIKQQLKSVLKESNRSNRTWSIVLGALWFVLGIVTRGSLG